jgi:phosphoribosylaminoimidazole-succinocarboxamide synthase
MIVKKVKRIPVECVVRGYLAGSAWAEYQQSGTVCGVRLVKGFKESQALLQPMFTPTTKAETGHDQSLTLGEMKKLVGNTLSRLKKKALLSTILPDNTPWREALLLPIPRWNSD